MGLVLAEDGTVEEDLLSSLAYNKTEADSRAALMERLIWGDPPDKTLGSFELSARSWRTDALALLRDNDHSDPEIKQMFPELFQPVRFKALLHYWVLEGNPYFKVTHRRIHRTLDLFRF